MATLTTILTGFSQRFFDASVIGTIICTTLFAETTKFEGRSLLTSYVPIIGIAAVAGMVLCVPFMFASFIMDIGFVLPSPRSGHGKTTEFNLGSISKRGEEIACKAGLDGKLVFKVKKDVGIAYSIMLGKKIIIGEELFAGKENTDNLDAIIAHEIIHLTPGNYAIRSARLLLYLAPFMLLFYWERLLPEAALLPYLFAMMVYPMKQASHWSEYDADEGSARLVGPEKIVSALSELRRTHGDNDSFTHPSFTKRIKRIQRKFHVSEQG